MKKNLFENFMNIKFSEEDKETVYDYFNENYNVFKIKEKDIKQYVYSKIVLLFRNQDDFYDALEDTYYIKDATHCWNWNEEKLLLTLYTESEECFKDCCEQLDNCDCDIYQFVYDKN